MRYILYALIGVLLLCGNSYALELSQSELFWLTQNIYWESRNQNENGQSYIALVTINRMMSWQLPFEEVGERWPSTIKGVVTQPKRFSWYWDGKSDIPKNTEKWKECREIAISVSKLWDLLEPEWKKIFWYHHHNVNWKYKKYYKLWSQVDAHIFYTPKDEVYIASIF